ERADDEDGEWNVEEHPLLPSALDQHLTEVPTRLEPRVASDGYTGLRTRSPQSAKSTGLRTPARRSATDAGLRTRGPQSANDPVLRTRHPRARHHAPSRRRR